MSFNNKYWDTAKNNLADTIHGHNTNATKTELFEKWIIGQNISFSPNWKILDIGSGMGRWSLWLAPKVKEVTALDISNEMLKFIRLRARNENIENILLVKSDINDWNINNKECYDLIICSGILELLKDEECEKLVNKIFCSLKKGGLIIFRDHIVKLQKTKNDFFFLRTRKYYTRLFSKSGFSLKKDIIAFTFFFDPLKIKKNTIIYGFLHKTYFFWQLFLKEHPPHIFILEKK
ncbi:MAG: class I SAM-dependent methyltransferase [bacterium]|nr:class I SAM-dependent methyltransferase [bacterium]